MTRDRNSLPSGQTPNRACPHRARRHHRRRRYRVRPEAMGQRYEAYDTLARTAGKPSTSTATTGLLADAPGDSNPETRMLSERELIRLGARKGIIFCVKALAGVYICLNLPQLWKLCLAVHQAWPLWVRHH
jgi:hypothetical protein